MRMFVFRVFTGPTLVNTAADRLVAAGLDVTVRGTENVYVQADTKEHVLDALNEGPRHDRWTHWDVHELREVPERNDNGSL